MKPTVLMVMVDLPSIAAEFMIVRPLVCKQAAQPLAPRRCAAPELMPHDEDIARRSSLGGRRARRLFGFRPWLGRHGRRRFRLGCDKRVMHPALGRDLAHLLHLQPTAPAFELHDAGAPGKTADDSRFLAGADPQIGRAALDHVNLPGRRMSTPRGPGNQRQHGRCKNFEDGKMRVRHRRSKAPFETSNGVGPI